MKLPFEVKAVEGGDVLAAFQYREWAEEWRIKMCATGIIVEDVTPEPEQHTVAECGRCHCRGHLENECEWPFPQGHANQMQRDSDWGRLNSQVVGGEQL